MSVAAAVLKELFVDSASKLESFDRNQIPFDANFLLVVVGTYVLGCALYDKVVDIFYRDSWGFLVLIKDSKTGLGNVLSQKTKILEHFKEITILPL